MGGYKALWKIKIKVGQMDSLVVGFLFFNLGELR
jgi:hypothetical protein